MTTSYEGDPGHLLGAIFSASPDAIVVVDQSGTIVMSNGSVTSLFGYYPEELVGASVATLLPLERRDVHSQHISEFFSSPHPRQMGAGMDLAGRHREGWTFPVDVSLAPVQVRNRTMAAAFIRDATEGKRAIERMHAINDITQSLLSGAASREILPALAARARTLLRADAAWVVLPQDADKLEIAVVDGPGTDALEGIVLSARTSRSAQVMESGRSDVIDDLSTTENVPRQCADLDLGPGIYVPLVEKDRRLGALVLGRTHGASPFSTLEVAFVEAFASAVTAAVQLGDARSEIERLGIVAEDERIARDLHDTVIQQLFAIGMSLQATRRGADAKTGERIDAAVDDLDAVIKEVRNTIFRLPARGDGSESLREGLLEIAERSSTALGFSPRVAFHGPIDTAVPSNVLEHAEAVLTEALANVARHAKATSVEVIVSAAEDSLAITVVDDGQGIGDGPTAGNGLRNIAARAEQFGGSCEIRQRVPRGTIVEWRVPL